MLHSHKATAQCAEWHWSSGSQQQELQFGELIPIITAVQCGCDWINAPPQCPSAAHRGFTNHGLAKPLQIPLALAGRFSLRQEFWALPTWCPEWRISCRASCPRPWGCWRAGRRTRRSSFRWPPSLRRGCRRRSERGGPGSPCSPASAGTQQQAHTSPAHPQLPNSKWKARLIQNKWALFPSKHKPEMSHWDSHPTRHMLLSRLQNRDVIGMGDSCLNSFVGWHPVSHQNKDYLAERAEKSIS